MPTPTLTAPLTRPDIADPLVWGPYLRRCWLERGPAHYAEEMAHARGGVFFAAPHGTLARIGQWGMFGVDPGQPVCTCGCAPEA